MPFDINFGALEQANPFAAYAQGQEFAAKQAQRKASAQAGQKLASGDRKGAMADLGGVGLVDDVRQLQGDQQQQDEAAKAAEIQAQHERAKALMTVAQGLKQIPAGQRKAALDNVMPVFQQIGIDPSMFGQLTEDQLTDQNLDIFSGQVADHVKVLNTSGGVVAVDTRALGRDMADPKAVQTLYQDPYAGPLKEAQIAAARARAGASSASAEAARARAARTRSMPTGGSGGSAAALPGLPPGYRPK